VVRPDCGAATAKKENHMDALLIKVPEAAGISRANLYELIGSGALPTVKVGGCRRVRTDDLRAYVDGLSPSR